MRNKKKTFNDFSVKSLTLSCGKTIQGWFQSRGSAEGLLVAYVAKAKAKGDTPRVN